MGNNVHSSSSLSGYGMTYGPRITGNVMPNVMVYSSVLAGMSFIEDISNVIDDYEHTIRLQGGYWSANWTMTRAKAGDSRYTEWKTNRLWCHVIERTGISITWEGYIGEITADDDGEKLYIVAYGYVHTIQNKYVTASVAGTDNADVWIELIRSTDCEFIPNSEIAVNPIQVRTASELQCWSEMTKITSLGDSAWNIWQIGVYNDRRLYYNALNVSPRYYVRSGIQWRVDFNKLYNYVIVSYTDETGAVQPDETGALQASIDIYGTRQLKLNYTYLPTATATNLAQITVIQNCWPYYRAVGSAQNIQVYDSIGSNAALSPWIIQPSICRDTSIPEGTRKYLGWLTSANDFVVSEVVARQTGVQLRSTDYDEADTLELQLRYARDTGEKDYDLSD